MMPGSADCTALTCAAGTSWPGAVATMSGCAGNGQASSAATSAASVHRVASRAQPGGVVSISRSEAGASPAGRFAFIGVPRDAPGLLWPAGLGGPGRIHQLSDIMISNTGSLETMMAQVVVRQLEEDVKARLKRRAERHGRSMEEEMREILRNAAREESRSIARLGSRIAARFRKVGLRDDLPELRGQSPRPADLAK